MDSAYRIKIPLKSVLNALAMLEAVLAFFMGYEVIGRVYSLCFLVLALSAFLMEWLGLGHPPRLLVNLAAPAGLLAIFTRVRRNYLIEALVEAVFLMIAVKMLERKRARDYVQIAALGFAAVVSYSMLSIAKSFIIYAPGMALASTMTLTLCAWFGKDESAAMSPRELRQFCLRVLAIFCMTLPMCFMLFFALPRTASPFLGRRGTYGNPSTGFSDQVRLGDASSIQADRKLAFRAETQELAHIPSLYWRGMTLDVFDGAAWSALRIPRGRERFIPDPQAPLVEQEIFLEPGNRGYLFAIDQPVEVSGPGLETVTDGEGSFRYAGRGRGQRLQYHAVSALSQRMAPPSGQISRRRYLRLPENFMPRLAALVEEITGGLENEKISAITAFLSSSDFTYSLDELPSGRNALERFIFYDKKGNCEYYASAMGVMLRMAGVPARLVSGYRGGMYNETGGYYIVQEQNAHVWVEAWDPALGAWTRYDPTPYAAGGGDDELNVFELYLDFIDYQWSKMIVNYNLANQLDIAQSLRAIIQNPRESLTVAQDGFHRIAEALFIPAAVLAALGACAAFFYAARSYRRRRPEITLLRKFLRLMKRRGYGKSESEGLTEFLARVDDASLRTAASPFAREFEELYFGGGANGAMDGKLTLKRLRQHLDDLTRQI